MLKDTDALHTSYGLSEPLEPLLTAVYFFHSVRLICHTNSPAIQAILDATFGVLPQPEKIEGEVRYSILCYESAAEFPVQLPRRRVRTDTMRLLTNGKLKYYRSLNNTMQFQRYEALPPVNEEVLSVITPEAGVALTQLVMPEHYQAAFLRRYVFLLALGQLLHGYGFEPCHAGAVTAVGDSRQGALIIGPSGSGKTTLSLGCTLAGCGLLGDDLVMLREDAATTTIGAYAVGSEVSLRSGSLDLWPSLAFLRELPVDARDKRYCSIEQIRSGASCTQTAIRLLVFPALTTEATSTLTALSKASTLQELVDNCLDKKSIGGGQSQERLFVLLSRLAEQARGYRLTIARGANDGPQLVCSLFAGNAL